MPRKKRVAFYVDGFNLYHALVALGRDRNGRPVPGKNHLKWLSIYALARKLMQSQTEELKLVVYFTAMNTYMPKKLVRHRAYVAALRRTGVEVVLGRFKVKELRCDRCGNVHSKPEEKETDVNIATRIVHDAFRDAFDVFYLVSADTDLCPAIRLLRKVFPKKEFVTVATPRRGFSAEILALNPTRRQRITEETIERCLLPEKIAGAGHPDIIRPVAYTPVVVVG